MSSLRSRDMSRHMFSELAHIYLIWLSNCLVFCVLKEESFTDLIFLNLELVASCFAFFFYRGECVTCHRHSFTSKPATVN